MVVNFNYIGRWAHINVKLHFFFQPKSFRMGFTAVLRYKNMKNDFNAISHETMFSHLTLIRVCGVRADPGKLCQMRIRLLSESQNEQSA